MAMEEKLEKVIGLLEEINLVLHPDPEARLKTLLNIAVHGLEPMEYNDIIEMLQLLEDHAKNTTDPLRVLATMLYKAYVGHELRVRAASGSRSIGMRVRRSSHV